MSDGLASNDELLHRLALVALINAGSPLHYAASQLINNGSVLRLIALHRSSVPIARPSSLIRWSSLYTFAPPLDTHDARRIMNYISVSHWWPRSTLALIAPHRFSVDHSTVRCWHRFCFDPGFLTRRTTMEQDGSPMALHCSSSRCIALLCQLFINHCTLFGVRCTPQAPGRGDTHQR